MTGIKKETETVKETTGTTGTTGTTEIETEIGGPTGRDLPEKTIEPKKKRIPTTKSVETSRRSEEVTPRRLRKWRSNSKNRLSSTKKKKSSLKPSKNSRKPVTIILT